MGTTAGKLVLVWKREARRVKSLPHSLPCLTCYDEVFPSFITALVHQKCAADRIIAYICLILPWLRASCVLSLVIRGWLCVLIH